MSEDVISEMEGSLRGSNLSTEVNEMKEIATDKAGGRVFQARGTASAKALGPECARHTAGTARNSVWLESRFTGKSDG